MGPSVLGFVLFGVGVVLLRLLSSKKSVLRSDGAAVTAAIFITILLTFGGGLILGQLIAL
ncbi:MAG: hypothetical protein Q8M19_13790 [Reyranella sp.]|nr:hypothetical protein [Reyranella sp.]